MVVTINLSVQYIATTGNYATRIGYILRIMEQVPVKKEGKIINSIRNN
jgi:hypothetical protein